MEGEWAGSPRLLLLRRLLPTPVLPIPPPKPVPSDLELLLQRPYVARKDGGEGRPLLVSQRSVAGWKTETDPAVVGAASPADLAGVVAADVTALTDAGMVTVGVADLADAGATSPADLADVTTLADAGCRCGRPGRCWSLLLRAG